MDWIGLDWIWAEQTTDNALTRQTRSIREKEQELSNKHRLLGSGACKAIVRLLEPMTERNEHLSVVSPLPLLSLVQLLEAALCSHAETTTQEHYDGLLRMVASRYESLLALIRSPCAGIREGAALLMRVVVEDCDANMSKMLQASHHGA